jgi:hypothetical protein
VTAVVSRPAVTAVRANRATDSYSRTTVGAAWPAGRAPALVGGSGSGLLGHLAEVEQPAQARDDVQYVSHFVTRQPLGWPTVECV